MEANENKGRVCVTGGTGYLGSWIVKKLLEGGYYVNTTIRPNPDGSKKDISYLTNLPGASERLQIFNADLDNPDSFSASIEGCTGVFHVAHPMEFDKEESEVTGKSIRGILGILESCVNSKTVKKVVYTSSAATVLFGNDCYSDNALDEDSWTDVDLVRKLNLFGGSYVIAKTLTEKAALEFAEKHSLDLVSVIPTWIHGPFMSPSLPGSVSTSLAMILGKTNFVNYHENIPFVHIDDVARAHIYLFEHHDAKGRYICSSVDIKTNKLYEFLSSRYPKYQILSLNFFTSQEVQFPVVLSSKKLLDTGFMFEYGLEEMYDGAIECCKQRDIL